MNKYPFFKYVTGDSKMHVMNSKMKIIWFLAMLLCTLIYRDYVSAGQALGASNFKNLFTKDSMNKVLGRLSSIGGNLGTWAQNKWNEYAVGKGNTLGDMNVRVWDNQDYNLA